MQRLLAAAALCAGAATGEIEKRRILVEMVGWQGCPDTIQYSKNLLNNLLLNPDMADLAKLIDLKAVYTEGSHPNVEYSEPFHAWVACSDAALRGDATYLDPQWRWYQVLSCADPSNKAGGSIDDCIKNSTLTGDDLAMFTECTSDNNTYQPLIDRMHDAAKFAWYTFWPTVLVGSRTLPRPDRDNNRVEPLIAAACKVYWTSPDAYSSDVPRACVRDSTTPIIVALVFLVAALGVAVALTSVRRDTGDEEQELAEELQDS